MGNKWRSYSRATVEPNARSEFTGRQTRIMMFHATVAKNSRTLRRYCTMTISRWHFDCLLVQLANFSLVRRCPSRAFKAMSVGTDSVNRPMSGNKFNRLARVTRAETMFSPSNWSFHRDATLRALCFVVCLKLWTFPRRTPYGKTGDEANPWWLAFVREIPVSDVTRAKSTALRGRKWQSFLFYSRFQPFKGKFINWRLKRGGVT